MYILGIVILVLTFLLMISLTIIASRRKKSPWYVHALGYLIIGLCVSEAIILRSIWPICTAGIIVLVLVIRYRVNRYWDIVEMHKRDQKMREELHEQEIRNRAIRKSAEGDIQ